MENKETNKITARQASERIEASSLQSAGGDGAPALWLFQALAAFHVRHTRASAVLLSGEYILRATPARREWQDRHSGQRWICDCID